MYSGKASRYVFRAILSSLIIFTSVSTSAGAETPEKTWLHRYEKLRDAVYNSEMDEDRILGLYEETLSEIEKEDSRGGEGFYRKALTAYMAGRFYLNNGVNEEKAALYFEKALEENERWRQAAGETSEYFRLKSEVTSQLCLVKPVGFILKNGPEVNTLAKKALEINPENGKAVIQMASAKVYPPRIYGGNPKKGIGLLEEALQTPGLGKDDLFNIYSGLGLAYLRLKEYDESVLWLEKALALYPENEYCIMLLEDALNQDAGKNEERTDQMRRERERER